MTRGQATGRAISKDPLLPSALLAPSAHSHKPVAAPARAARAPPASWRGAPHRAAALMPRRPLGPRPSSTRDGRRRRRLAGHPVPLHPRVHAPPAQRAEPLDVAVGPAHRHLRAALLGEAEVL